MVEPDPNELWSLVPTADCKPKVLPKVCYEGSVEMMRTILLQDIFDCPGQGPVGASLVKALCKDSGYDFSLGKDPIYRGAKIYSKGLSWLFS
jgi:hypothetical protein